MVDNEQIKRWLKEGTITQAQAKKMVADASKDKKERSSNKLIVAVSTIGAILLGIGAILFIASNWQEMSNPIKVAILVGSTFAAYYAGYLFKYQKKNLPKVGASLMFLGTLLFGATIFLIAQMYNINANSHTLLLIWLIGVLPLVYVFKSVPIAALSSLLFFIWFGLYLFRGSQLWDILENLLIMPVFYILAGIVLFCIGGLHYFRKELKDIARTYRIAGIKVVMVSLFLMTFEIFSGSSFGLGMEFLQILENFKAPFVVLSIIALLMAVINWFFNPSKSNIIKLEGTVSLGLVGITMLFFFYPPGSSQIPSASNLYTIFFNLIMAGVILAIIFVGYTREDMKLVNMGMFWASLFIVVKYFDWFWGMLDRAIFFLVFGVILILGGIALEKKRRQLKSKFAK